MFFLTLACDPRWCRQQLFDCCIMLSLQLLESLVQCLNHEGMVLRLQPLHCHVMLCLQLIHCRMVLSALLQSLRPAVRECMLVSSPRADPLPQHASHCKQLMFVRKLKQIQMQRCTPSSRRSASLQSHRAHALDRTATMSAVQWSRFHEAASWTAPSAPLQTACCHSI